MHQATLKLQEGFQLGGGGEKRAAMKIGKQRQQSDKERQI